MRRFHIPAGFRAELSGFPRNAVVVCAVLLVTILPGCGRENELGRLPFSGTVTLDGQPLEQGSIAFEPTQSGEGKTRSGAPIVDGEFRVDTLKGLPPGEYLVRINAAGDKPPPPDDQAPGMLGPPPKELIPPEYNVRSEKTITIKAGQENHFPFNIETGG